MKIEEATWLGRQFGRLVVVRCSEKPNGASNKGGKWLCRCDCGKEVERTGYRLSPIKATANVGCGCKLIPPILTEAQLDEAVKLYNGGMSIWKISDVFGIYGQSVWKYLKRRGVKFRNSSERNRDYPVNELAFDSINEQSAYWAGFMMADGCVQNSGKSYAISLSLAVVDYRHVELFRDFIAPQAKVFERKKNIGASCTFRVRSRLLGEALIRLGVTPRKSFTAKVCDELALNRDFWRGEIDGDGSIHLIAEGYWALNLVGSHDGMMQFAAFCSHILPGFDPTVKATANIFRVSMAGRKAAIILKALYDGCSVALERKRLLALEAIKAGSNIPNDRTLVYHGQLSGTLTEPSIVPRGYKGSGRRGGKTSLQKVTVGCETDTIRHFAEKHGQKAGVVYARMYKLGWTLEEALGLVPRKSGRGMYHAEH